VKGEGREWGLPEARGGPGEVWGGPGGCVGVWLEKWGWLVREAQGWYWAEKERRRGVVALYNLRRLGMGGPCRWARQGTMTRA